MSTTLKKQYDEKIAPALMKQFNYSTPMQIPRLVKIVLNEGLGDATQDKKIIETAINELTAITGQKAVQTLSKKDISNFKVRKKMPIGVRVTLRCRFGKQMHRSLSQPLSLSKGSKGSVSRQISPRCRSASQQTYTRLPQAYLHHRQ